LASVNNALSGCRVTTLLDDLYAVFHTPRPERLVSRLFLERMSPLDQPSRLQELLETAIRPLALEDVHHLVKSIRHLLGRKTKNEALAESQVILVWYRDLSVGYVEVVWNLLIHRDQLGYPVDSSSLE
jgi:hypothetical protein